MTEVLILPEDIGAAGFCMRGMREWTKTYGVTHLMDDLLKAGVPVSKIRAVNCPLGNKVCDAAEKRHSLRKDP